MIKILSIFVLFSSSIFAQNFDEFLNKALQNSPYLKSVNLSIKQASLKGEVLSRYENPALELEYSYFKPDVIKQDNGYRVAISQPIRLWGVGNDKESFANSMQNRAKANYLLSKAQFTKSLSLLFSKYVQEKELYFLAKEELLISSRIYEISEQRYKAGTISKGEMLQAKVDLEMQEIRLYGVNLSYKEKYFKLLELAGYTQEIELNHNYNFSIVSKQSSRKNPDLDYINRAKEESLALAKLNSNKVEWMDFFGEYEKEPEQSIYRVGISVPLAIFNTKKEELQIAKLETNKTQFLAQKQQAKIRLLKTKLKQERSLLENLKVTSKKTLQTQEKLLEMFEDSYKIASVNLLELQNIKNGVIKTKESIIKTKFALDANAINTNYITGAYNE